MEIQFAFLALAFFAAFMAARSLTAYFKKSNSAAKRGCVSAAHECDPACIGSCMSKKNVRTFVKAGAVGASNIATELNRAFAAARVNALMGGVDLGDTIDPLSAIHKALKAAHASGELTDQQYTEKARELLVMLGNAVVSLFIQQNMSRTRPPR